jgi:hypothetical protein
MQAPSIKFFHQESYSDHQYSQIRCNVIFSAKSLQIKQDIMLFSAGTPPSHHNAAIKTRCNAVLHNDVIFCYVMF